MIFKSIVFLTVIISYISLTSVSNAIIYGKDHRKDYYRVKSRAWRKLSKSIVVLVDKKHLKKSRGKMKVSSKILWRKKEFGAYMCPKERFKFQPTFADACTGFLVAPNIIATAGHCIDSLKECKETAFIFDYAKRNFLFTKKRFSKRQVYYCQELIYSTNKLEVDYALIRLKRKVVGRTPLKMRGSGVIQAGTRVTAIGHPAGLPIKFAGGASVKKVSEEKFISNLDTYGGNSGSPIFNNNTKLVEGMLIYSLESDYRRRRVCYVTKRVSNNSAGEVMMKIKYLKKRLKSYLAK